jgi:hypothetical protein
MLNGIVSNFSLSKALSVYFMGISKVSRVYTTSREASGRGSEDDVLAG